VDAVGLAGNGGMAGNDTAPLEVLGSGGGSITELLALADVCVFAMEIAELALNVCVPVKTSSVLPSPVPSGGLGRPTVFEGMLETLPWPPASFWPLPIALTLLAPGKSVGRVDRETPLPGVTGMNPRLADET